mmetsp:Transcript_14869/g.30647  ORF Transcript_14869/g.30647 Transcript_14869/m.30647 type:complete len:230 (-) Transcript_14869:176-865(-)
MASIFNNGDYIGALFGHTQEITSGTVTEFHSVDRPRWAHNIRYMTDTGTSGGTNVQHLTPRFDPNMINTPQNSSSQLRSKGVPNTVFHLAWHRDFCTSGGWYFDTNALFPIDSHTRRRVQRDQGIFLSTGNENSFVAMRFHQNLGTTLHSAAATTTASSTATSASITPTAASTASSASTATSTKSSSATASTKSSSASTSTGRSAAATATSAAATAKSSTTSAHSDLRI